MVEINNQRKALTDMPWSEGTDTDAENQNFAFL